MSEGIGITIAIDTAPVAGMLGQLAAFPDQLSPALEAIGAAMVTATALRFDSGTAPDGSTWTPSKRVEKKGGKTLVLSGRLWHSLTYNVLAGAVEWGTNVIYAAIHQLGGTIEREARTHTIYRKASKDRIEPGFVKKAKSNFAQDVAIGAFNITIPARPFLGINAEDLNEVRDVLNRYLATAMGAA